jgi:hypothetical protein
MLGTVLHADEVIDELGIRISVIGNHILVPHYFAS